MQFFEDQMDLYTAMKDENNFANNIKIKLAANVIIKHIEKAEFRDKMETRERALREELSVEKASGGVGRNNLSNGVLANKTTAIPREIDVIRVKEEIKPEYEASEVAVSDASASEPINDDASASESIKSELEGAISPSMFVSTI